VAQRDLEVGARHLAIVQGVECNETFLELRCRERLAQERQHPEAVMRADLMHLAQRLGLVTAAHHHERPVETAVRQAAHHLDRVGIAERQIDHDQVRCRQRERHLHIGGAGELAGATVQLAKQPGHNRAHGRIVIQHVDEPLSVARSV
jgi:hypothetical protein